MIPKLTRREGGLLSASSPEVSVRNRHHSWCSDAQIAGDTFCENREDNPGRVESTLNLSLSWYAPRSWYISSTFLQVSYYCVWEPCRPGASTQKDRATLAEYLLGGKKTRDFSEFPTNYVQITQNANFCDIGPVWFGLIPNLRFYAPSHSILYLPSGFCFSVRTVKIYNPGQVEFTLNPSLEFQGPRPWCPASRPIHKRDELMDELNERNDEFHPQIEPMHSSLWRCPHLNYNSSLYSFRNQKNVFVDEFTLKFVGEFVDELIRLWCGWAFMLLCENRDDNRSRTSAGPQLHTSGSLFLRVW